MKKFNYYLGWTVGVLGSSILFVYPLFDAYFNIKNHHSVAADLALVFAFATWQKVSRMYNAIVDMATQNVYNNWLNSRKEG